VCSFFYIIFAVLLKHHGVNNRNYAALCATMTLTSDLFFRKLGHMTWRSCWIYVLIIEAYRRSRFWRKYAAIICRFRGPVARQQFCTPLVGGLFMLTPKNEVDRSSQYWVINTFYSNTFGDLVTLTFDLLTLESSHDMSLGLSTYVPSLNRMRLTVPQLRRLKWGCVQRCDMWTWRRKE